MQMAINSKFGVSRDPEVQALVREYDLRAVVSEANANGFGKRSWGLEQIEPFASQWSGANEYLQNQGGWYADFIFQFTLLAPFELPEVSTFLDEESLNV